MKQNCIRCKRTKGIINPLKAVKVIETKDYKNYKYACECGCTFERTIKK